MAHATTNRTRTARSLTEALAVFALIVANPVAADEKFGAWIGACELDQIRDRYTCSITNEGERISGDGYTAFQVIRYEEGHVYMALLNQQHPRHTATVRVDDNPPRTLSTNAYELPTDLAAELRAGDVMLAETWSWDGPTRARYDLAGFAEALAWLDSQTRPTP